MLVLTRKPGEKIVIGNSVIVTVLEAAKNKVSIGISAPDDIPVLREELAWCAEVNDEELEPQHMLSRHKAYWAEASEAFIG